MRKWNDDPFTKRARKENFAARSIYKLEEIDKREKLLSGAKRVLDLGAAPGSWSQYCLKVLPSNALVYAIDLNPMEVSDPRIHFLQGNWSEIDLGKFLNSPVDIVLSDMAPKTTGIHEVDVAASLALVEGALAVARNHLKQGGHFVAKVFMGEGYETLQAELKNLFRETRLIRPESTRKQSREIFLIAKGRR